MENRDFGMKENEEVNELQKHPNHDHWWIRDGFLNESYNTLRGLRYMTICEAPDFDDDNFCTDEKAEYIFRENHGK